MESMSPFNVSGNIITPNGPNLKIDRSAGILFRLGVGFRADHNNPHRNKMRLMVWLGPRSPWTASPL